MSACIDTGPQPSPQISLSAALRVLHNASPSCFGPFTVIRLYSSVTGIPFQIFHFRYSVSGIPALHVLSAIPRFVICKNVHHPGSCGRSPPQIPPDFHAFFPPLMLAWHPRTSVHKDGSWALGPVPEWPAQNGWQFHDKGPEAVLSLSAPHPLVYCAPGWRVSESGLH